MRRAPRPLLVLAGLAGVLSAPARPAALPAQAPPAPAPVAQLPAGAAAADARSEWRALRRELAEARAGWNAAAGDGPAAPGEASARALLARLVALAPRLEGTPEAVPALTECARVGAVLARSDRAAGEAARERALARLLEQHLGDPELGPACEALGAAAVEELGLERAEAFLQAVRAKTASAAVREGAELGLARAWCDALDGLPSDGPRRLRALLEELAARAPATRRTRAAADLLFAWDHVRVQREAPEVDACDTTGAPVRLADLRGKVVLLVFWSTPDAPTRAALSAHAARAARLRERPFALIGVHGEADPEADEALDAPLRALLARHGRVAPAGRAALPPEARALFERLDELDRARTRERAAAAGATFRQAVDGALDGPWARRWDVRRRPATIVLDARGRLRFKDLPPDELDRALDALLDEAARDR